MDRLRLHGLQVYCRVGHLPEERRVGHHVEVDVELRTDLREAGRRDTLDATLDYAAVAAAVHDAAEGREFTLLEGAAEAIVAAVRDAATQPVEGITVRVRKLRPPVPGVVMDHAEVELTRPGTTD